jgi:hypothetical protein
MKNSKGMNGPVGQGYGQPPIGSRFVKGLSGNPRGRPRGTTPGRIANMILSELYRPMKIKEGEKVVRLPSIQAIVRAEVMDAVQGKPTGNVDLIEMAQHAEEALALQEQIEQAMPVVARHKSALEAALWIRFLQADVQLEAARQRGLVPDQELLDAQEYCEWYVATRRVHEKSSAITSPTANARETHSDTCE